MCCTAGSGSATVITEFHGLSESPFSIMPNPRLAWLGSGMRKVRAELCTAVLQGRGLAVLSGGPGVGKSLALKLLANDLKQSGAPCSIHALNWGLQISVTEVLRRVAEGAADDDRAPATDRLTVLLIDEAQHLGSAELGEFLQETALRGGRLHLVLAGAPEVELAVNEALAEHPRMVATHWLLEPLRLDEISSYVAGRLKAAGGGGREIFTADAIECLAQHSSGVPRRLNVLCCTALFLAWREGRQGVDASIVEAALPAFNPESLTDAAEPPPPARMSTSPQRPLIQASDLPEVKGVPIAELESAAPEPAAEPTTLEGVRSEMMEFVTARTAQSESIAAQTNPPETAGHLPGAARIETCESATDLVVAATPVSREIARLQPKTKAVARQHRLVMVAKWAQMRRPALYVPVVAAAAIVFQLVAIDWRARDEQPAGRAIALMTAMTILPPNPPIIAAPSQPTAPFSSPSTGAAEPIIATAPAEGIAAVAPVSAGAVTSVASDDGSQDSQDAGDRDKAGDTDLFDRQVAATAPTVAAVAPMSASAVILVPSDDGSQGSQDAGNTSKAGDTDLSSYLPVASTAPAESVAAVAPMSASAVIVVPSDGEPRGGQGTSDTDKFKVDRFLPTARTVRAARSTAVRSASISTSAATGISADSDQSGSVQSGSDQSGGAQSGSDQSGGAQSGSDQSGGAQIGSGQSGSAQSESDHSGSAHSGSAQSESDHSGSVHSGSDQSGSAQTGSAQSGSAQSESDHSGSAQSGSDQSGNAQSGGKEKDSKDKGGKGKGGKDKGPG
jgi:general secretion pathway protein A